MRNFQITLGAFLATLTLILAPVAALHGQALPQTADVTLAWDLEGSAIVTEYSFGVAPVPGLYIAQPRFPKPAVTPGNPDHFRGTLKLEPGTYYVAIRAHNAMGTSAWSNEVTVTVLPSPGGLRQVTVEIQGSADLREWKSLASIKREIEPGPQFYRALVHAN